MKKEELINKMKDLIELNPGITRELIALSLKVNSLHIHKYWTEAGGVDKTEPVKKVKRFRTETGTRFRYIKDRNKEIVRNLIDNNMKRVPMVYMIMEKSGLGITTVYRHLKTIKEEKI